MPDAALHEVFLESVVFRFRATKQLAEKTFDQLRDPDLFWSPDPESNSIAIIAKHIHGNMMSRWTDFLTTDGEKPWRDRDGEFVVEPGSMNRSELSGVWEEGWACLFAALAGLQPDDLTRNITIRGGELSVADAILRQLSHYGYHVGQIVFLAKQIQGADWQTLSVARGQSKAYKPKGRD